MDEGEYAMELYREDLTIRNAMPEDAETLCGWWNDGKVMEHAGFPNGLGIHADEIRESLLKDSDDSYRRLILEIDRVPVGEMSYHNMGNRTAEIGIKICDFSKQERGNGTRFLLMLIEHLLMRKGYEKIVLDTNLKNARAQHVYEKIGFSKVGVRVNSWKDQLGELQSCVDYELTKDVFIQKNVQS
jgi:RimJ/RimL family protein N-acetyltransferase